MELRLKNRSHSLRYACFIGPKTPTSRGWIRCDVCGGKHNSSISFSLQIFDVWKSICEPWLSKRRRIGRTGGIFLMKIFFTKNRKDSVLIHPFGVARPTHPGDRSTRYDGLTYFPGNNTIEGNQRPSAHMHARFVIWVLELDVR